MLRDAAVQLLKARLARFDDTTIEAHIIAELQAAQDRLEAEATLPWFLISERAYIDTAIAEERILLPGDFLQEVEEEGGVYVESDGTETRLKKMDYDDMVGRFSSPGKSRAYAMMGKYFRIRPLPDTGTTYRIRMVYYKKDTVLSTNIENGWLKYFPEVLMAEAGIILAGLYIKDMEIVQIFGQLLQSARQTMLTTIVAREAANREYWSED